MPRPLKVDRPVALKVWLPTSINDKVKRELYSEVEGKVPFGAQSELVEILLTEWLKGRGVQV
jgi:hypothetical protein